MGVIRPDRMEVACVRPGLWRAEGYTIARVAARRWEVSRQYTGEAVEEFGARPTLTEAFDLVDDLLNG